MKHICADCYEDLYCIFFWRKIRCGSVGCLIKKTICFGCPYVRTVATDRTNCDKCAEKRRYK